MKIDRTMSGAYIIDVGDQVIKLGEGSVGERIGQQAKWLKRYEAQGIMPIIEISSNAYAMPHCEDHIDGVDSRFVFEETVRLLQEYVWSYGPHINWDETRRRQLVFDKMCRTKMHKWEDMYDLFREITWMDLPVCLTHGDPTFCNTLWLNERHAWVLCDPIPSFELPDIRAIDLGKLLQSCFGFEQIMYGWKYSTPPNPLWVNVLCDSHNEWKAAIFFGMLHIMRLLPYAPLNFHEEFLKMYDDMYRLLP